MNKAELIEKVAEKAFLSKKDAAAATDAVFAAITDALKEKDSVRKGPEETLTILKRP